MRQYDRQGCDFVIKFSAKLSDEEYAWAFDLVKGNMESLYDASGYGWDDDDKKRELTEQGTRFLIVRERESGALAGFCHFRFSVQGDGECLVALVCTADLSGHVSNANVPLFVVLFRVVSPCSDGCDGW